MIIIINNREIKFRIWNGSEMVYDNILVGAMGIGYAF